MYMPKYLVCILCSSNIGLLNESVNSVINQQHFHDYGIFIIVNTLNELFYRDVLNEYGSNNHSKIKKVIRTESNGYPGKGHNSVLSIFYNQKSYDNLVMLDGDDFLYPCGLNRINNVMQTQKSDVIALVGNTKINLKYTNFTRSNNLTDSNLLYNLNKGYEIHHIKNIVKICDDYNKLLITPYRLMCMNRNLLEKYSKLYDERMFVYDDFLTTVILYKELQNNDYNITLLNDSYIYLYNAVNEDSVSLKYNNIAKIRNDKSDTKNKLLILEDFGIKREEYDLTTLKIIPYGSILQSNIDLNQMSRFYKKMIVKLQQLMPTILPNKNILFIDYHTWDYDTIKQRALGGTESAIYHVSKILSETCKYNVFVMTKMEKTTQVSKYLTYLYLNESVIQRIVPDIVIFQGTCPLPRSFFEEINNEIQLWLWCHHNTTVNFVEKHFKSDKYKYDKYIFVSKWQQNKYIQSFKLEHNKCIVMPNGISELVETRSLDLNNKEKCLIYFSTPYRGLLIAYFLFQEIKKQIPDIKFKIFSCFSREEYNSKTEYLPIKKVEDLKTHDLDVLYKPIYTLLLEDPNIEYYGSVPQMVLFQHVKKSMVFFYPNTYEETCCTSILESMAYRCNIVSSEIGAIPETSNSFAYLFNPCIDISLSNASTDESIYNPINYTDVSNKYKEDMIGETINIINNYYSDYNQELLDNQQNYIDNCNWKKRVELILPYIEE